MLWLHYNIGNVAINHLTKSEVTQLVFLAISKETVEAIMPWYLVSGVIWYSAVEPFYHVEPLITDPRIRFPEFN